MRRETKSKRELLLPTVQGWVSKGINSIEEQIIIVGKKANNAGGVVGASPYNLHPVSSFKVRFDHFIVLSVT